MRHTYTVGEPYLCLRAGDFFFLPWLDKHAFGEGKWMLRRNRWRTPTGARWTTGQVKDWARRTKHEVRREVFNPRLKGRFC